MEFFIKKDMFPSRNIEKLIQDAIERKLWYSVGVCQGYEECKLVLYKNEWYYIPNLTKKQIRNTTAKTCPKHKQQYLLEGRIQDLIKK
jgi:hypothetical protein